MSDHPRLEQLERRVRQDPASIGFAALAEEYRRAGRLLEAIDTCRTGLRRHPAYLSARVTLGRALLASGALDEARIQLEEVRRLAPDNLAAIRALDDLHTRQAAAPPTGQPAGSSLLSSHPETDRFGTTPHLAASAPHMGGAVAPDARVLAGLETFHAAIVRALG